MNLIKTDEKELLDKWGDSGDDSDEMDDESLRWIPKDLQPDTDSLADHNRMIRRCKRMSRSRKSFVNVKVDQFIGFTIDAYTASLINHLRNKINVVIIYYCNI